jgi:hypothetical protein
MFVLLKVNSMLGHIDWRLIMAKKKKVTKKKAIKKTTKKKVTKTKASKTKATSNYKRGTLTHSIYEYFDKVGVDNADYEKALSIAQNALPTTKFNKNHFSWYRNKYRELGGKGKWQKK